MEYVHTPIPCCFKVNRISIISNWISLSVFLYCQFTFFSWQFSHIHPRKGALRRLSKVACFSGDLTLLRRTTHFVRQFLRHELSTLFFSRRETAKWITTNPTCMCCFGVYSLAASQSVIIEFKNSLECWICALSDHAIFKIVVRKLPTYIKCVVAGLPVLKFCVFEWMHSVKILSIFKWVTKKITLTFCVSTYL